MNKFPIADVKNNLDYIKEQISSFDITNYLIDIKKRRKTEIKKIIEKQLIAVQNELNRDVLHFIKQNKL
jgi:CRISPR/Cas system-associated protein Cas5 (RAMP superfamily)